MSSFRRLHFFFRCYYCGNWLYSDRTLLSKKCTNPQCGKIIDFTKVKKQTMKINPTDAPRVIQYLKNGHNIIEPEFQTADKLIGGLNQK